MNPTALSRRDFLRLSLLAGSSLALAPFLKACAPQATSTPAATFLPTEDLLAGLDGLDIDAFFEQAYRRWLVRDPESLTVLGLSDFYGVGDADLTDISDEFLRATQTLEAGTLDLLRACDRAAFTADQSLTTDVYDWMLDDLVRGHTFMYDDYPLNPIVTSIHYNLYMLFTAYHPLNNLQDAEDYISRLSQMGTKISDLIDGLQRRAERGVILPAFIFPILLSELRETAKSNPTYHPYTSTFKNRLTGVSDEEKENLLARVEEQVGSVVAPAYQSLVDYFTELKKQASNTVGVWQFSDGAAYYAQCLRRQTTTDLTADEIHELGIQHVERVHAEMRTLFASLGYPAEDSIQNLYTRLGEDSGFYVGQTAVDAFEAIIAEAETILPQAFDIFPRARVEVVGGEQGNYYTPGAYDGSRPGLFYATTVGQIPKFGVKTLTYHETIPGHHFQIAIAQEQTGLPALRQGAQFNAYTEGWALYAERLMAELGAYTNDPQSNLGRLQMEAYRAARLVVDTGLHAKQWTFDEAVEYFSSAAGLPEGSGQGEITRYCVYPGQATSYYVGFLELLKLRQKAMDTLGDQFDLKAFHRVVLTSGSVPLSLLGTIIDHYIQENA